MKKMGNLIFIRLPSRELRLFYGKCWSSYGRVSNINHKLKKLLKAGNNIWRGFKPIVRGVAKNPVDHPHGGGQGKTKGGRCSVTPWGVLTKGKVTRSLKRVNKNILKRKRVSKI
jgi:large subunit ribosomal protein L2